MEQKNAHIMESVGSLFWVAILNKNRYKILTWTLLMLSGSSMVMSPDVDIWSDKFFKTRKDAERREALYKILGASEEAR